MTVRLTSAVVVTALLLGCGGRTVLVGMPEGEVAPELLAQLWVDPGREPRDLFWGVGGKQLAPRVDAVYTMKAKDQAGFSVSYDVVDPAQREWSAKIGPEAQTEVVMSRLLWGVGFHQPPVYYLPSWTVDEKGGPPRLESEARFRPKLPQLTRLDEYWRWAQNPFIGTRELNGLLVILLMMNSTDLKDDNNSIYTTTEPWDGAGRWFVVRDLGAALGLTGKLYPRRNWLEGFERGRFIKRVREDGTINFDYGGRHQELLGMIRTADVRWATERMRRLTDQQWQDAFRAANYPQWMADRYIRKIKQKIEEGAAIGGAPAPGSR